MYEGKAVKVTIKRSEIKTIGVAIISFYAVMSITYLSQIFHISSMVTLFMRLIIIVLLNFVMVIHNRKFSAVYKLLWIWWGAILFSSVLHNCDLLYLLTLQSRTVAVCSLLEYYSKYPQKLKAFLYTWKNILLVLCLLDTMTIILFPNGLYSGELYADVWLLGYKTARLVYNLPLAILTCYLSYWDRQKISVEALLTVACCALSCFMVDASGASVAILFYVVMIYYSAAGRKSEKLRIFLSKILNFKVIVAVYAVLVTLVVTGSTLVVRFAHNTLGKSETLSHRTIVWAQCIQHFFKNPILGKGYLTTDQYIERITLLRLGTNAHNMVLSILLTVGIVGMGIYIFILYTAIQHCGKRYSICSLILIVGTITYLVVGLSSSALVFSAFAFMPHLLMNYQMDIRSIAAEENL